MLSAWIKANNKTQKGFISRVISKVAWNVEFTIVAESVTFYQVKKMVKLRVLSESASRREKEK